MRCIALQEGKVDIMVTSWMLLGWSYWSSVCGLAKLESCFSMWCRCCLYSKETKQKSGEMMIKNMNVGKKVKHEESHFFFFFSSQLLSLDKCALPWYNSWSICTCYTWAAHMALELPVSFPPPHPMTKCLKEVAVPLGKIRLPLDNATGPAQLEILGTLV